MTARWRDARLWLAGWLAGEDYIVVPRGVFDALLEAHCSRVTEAISQALRGARGWPAEAASKPETRH